jgi:hypothetical protein
MTMLVERLMLVAQMPWRVRAQQLVNRRKAGLTGAQAVRRSAVAGHNTQPFQARNDLPDTFVADGEGIAQLGDRHTRTLRDQGQCALLDGALLATRWSHSTVGGIMQPTHSALDGTAGGRGRP